MRICRWVGIVALSSLSWGCPPPCSPGQPCGVTCPLGQSVPFPSGDATAPDPVNMDASFPAQPMQSVSNTSGAVTAKIINQPVITFIASGGDPQGMGDIQIWIEETWWRNNPDGTVTQTGPGLLGRPEFSNPVTRPPATNQACTKILASGSVDVATRRAGKDAYRIRAWAVGVNTAGGSTNTADMTLNWP
jgi:hypothetical protein